MAARGVSVDDDSEFMVNSREVQRSAEGRVRLHINEIYVFIIKSSGPCLGPSKMHEDRLAVSIFN
jgi:hypothetical protein